MRKTCNYLGIEYFPEKKEYWQKEQNTFFGSNSVRSTKALEAKQQLKKNVRKDLTYDAPNIQVVNHTKKEIQKKPLIKKVYDILENKRIDNSNKVKTIRKKYRFSRLIMELINMKNKIIRLYQYHFPKDFFVDNRKNKCSHS